jgi:hypothetical protein
VYLKVARDMVADKGLDGDEHGVEEEKMVQGTTHCNFLGLCTMYWFCHVLTIQDADFLSWCEESIVFREPKVGHGRGTGVDEVRRCSLPNNSSKTKTDG